MGDDIPQWAWDRADAEIEEWQFANHALAAYIAAHETPPVDPKVKAMKAALKEEGWSSCTEEFVVELLTAYESKLTELGAKP